MKVTIKGFVFWKKGYQEEGVFELLPWDCREWGEDNNDGRVFVKEHTTEVEIPDGFDPRPQQVAALEAEKQKARAEFQARVTEIDRQIQSLLAIEHEVIASLSGGPKAVAIIGNNTPDDGNEPMRFANARLIAAAPELLDALDGLAAQVRPLWAELDIDGFRHSALKEAYDFACKVAGKAQGEPQ